MATQKIEIVLTNRLERLGILLLGVVGLFAAIQWAHVENMLEKLTCVIAYALVCLFANWNRKVDVLPDTRIWRIIRAAQDENRLVASWTGKGSRTIEVIKALLKGAGVLLAREVLTWLIAIVFSIDPGKAGDGSRANAAIGVTIVLVLLLHLWENRHPQVQPEGNGLGLSRASQVAREEFAAFAFWSGRGTLPQEAIKGLVKGILVVVAKWALVACSAVFLNFWFALFVTAVVVSSQVYPENFRRFRDKIFNPQREPDTAPATPETTVTDLIKGQEAA
jgi:hypothetical protein